MNDTILVTGGTRGLGRGAALALLRADPRRHLILPVRNPAAGRAVAAQLATRSGNDNVHLVECDLANLASIRASAKQIERVLDDPAAPPLRGLLANAGVQRWRAPGRTEDGFEVTFATNVLGHYLLIRLLTHRLTAPGRVVLVSSSTHWGDLRHTWGLVAPPHWDAVEALARLQPAATRKDATAAYSTSKLALIYLTHELARRLPDGIDAYSYSPGVIPGTGLTREAPAIARFLGRTVFHAVRVLPGAVGANASGAELAAALTGPAPASTGSYLDRGRPAESSPQSHNPAREQELWVTAARLVGLDD